MTLNFSEEISFWKKGSRMAATDEVGRGPLAGPVLAAAVIIDKSILKHLENPLFGFVRDSKKLTEKKRKEVYEFLIKNELVHWGIGRIEVPVIDKVNIYQASRLAAKKAVEDLCQKIGGIDFLIIDGKNMILDLDVSQKSIIKADEKIFSCSAASIIAKVKRDELMYSYHKKYPCYGFDKHKGYGTKLHKEMIKKYGICSIHRKSFKLT